MPLVSCQQQEPPVLEPFLDPQIIQIPGQEFFIRGTIGGESFAIEHLSREEQNLPMSDAFDFSSMFIVEPANPFTRNKVYYSIIFGITNPQEETLAEVVRAGSLAWLKQEENPTIPEAFVRSLEWEERNYSSLSPSNKSNSSDFHISNIELVELAEPWSIRFTGRMYKLEGNFQTTLYTTNDLEQDSVELVIEEFSALFHDPIR